MVKPNCFTIVHATYQRVFRIRRLWLRFPLGAYHMRLISSHNKQWGLQGDVFIGPRGYTFYVLCDNPLLGVLKVVVVWLGLQPILKNIGSSFLPRAQWQPVLFGLGANRMRNVLKLIVVWFVGGCTQFSKKVFFLWVSTASTPPSCHRPSDSRLVTQWYM